jgi:hypothetical protein
MVANARVEIESRNQLRRGAGLPLLSAGTETARLNEVHREVEFEAFFDQQRSKHAHLWSGHGWMAGMGIWSRVRRQVRAEFEVRRAE